MLKYMNWICVIFCRVSSLIVGSDRHVHNVVDVKQGAATHSMFSTTASSS